MITSILTGIAPKEGTRKSKIESLAITASLSADLGYRESTLETVKALAEESQESSNLQSLDVSIFSFILLSNCYIGCQNLPHCCLFLYVFG